MEILLFITAAICIVWEVFLIVNVVKSAIRLKRNVMKLCSKAANIVQLIIFPVLYIFMAGIGISIIATVLNNLEISKSTIDILFFAIVICLVIDFLIILALCIIRLIQAIKENKKYALERYGVQAYKKLS